MSVLNTLPAPVIQMGHVEKIVEMAQNHPHVHQLVNQEEVKKNLRAESEQVAVTDKTAPGRKIAARKDEEGKRRQAQAETNERRHKNGDEEQPGEEIAKTNNPWTGNIVSITV